MRYRSFARENPYIWKFLFETPTSHYPDWYQLIIDEGKTVIKNTLKSTYDTDQETLDHILNFS